MARGRIRGSIPARAGNPPRVPASASFRGGPSPRVRGIQLGFGPAKIGERSIPARAGNPRAMSASARVARVHPRACGESMQVPVPIPYRPGPSPRVRGIPVAFVFRRHRPGSIPARAGNPEGSTRPNQSTRVHPRACGESLRDPRRARRGRGPSPRVRGIRGGEAVSGTRRRSIPARAGNPRAMSAAARVARVHPRACGESFSERAVRVAARGPSPRVRGIRSSPCSPAMHRGSIPARAGNPIPFPAAAAAAGVHPRACGESSVGGRCGVGGGGPSPRVRGILAHPTPRLERCGSIPARAGNPRASPAPPPRSTVHPRACGESSSCTPSLNAFSGPSPRVRGIRLPEAGHGRRAGSIPARAGNPIASGGGGSAGGVHPRACGESPDRWTVSVGGEGPSPRVRGIRPPGRSPRRRRGSIPARAGNPRPAPFRAPGRRVHPRACGESSCRAAAAVHAVGPSPRVRGILAVGGLPRRGRRSIPARAGNPRG